MNKLRNGYTWRNAWWHNPITSQCSISRVYDTFSNGHFTSVICAFLLQVCMSSKHPCTTIHHKKLAAKLLQGQVLQGCKQCKCKGGLRACNCHAWSKTWPFWLIFKKKARGYINCTLHMLLYISNNVITYR